MSFSACDQLNLTLLSGFGDVADRLGGAASTDRAVGEHVFSRPTIHATRALLLLVLFGAIDGWCRLRDLNPRPSVYKTAALPTELNRRRG